MRFARLSSRGFHDRIELLLSNTVPMLRQVFLDYFHSLKAAMDEGDGFWFQSEPGWTDANKATYDFVYYVEYDRSKQAHRDFYCNHKKQIHERMEQVARLVLVHLRKFSTQDVMLPHFLFARITMFADKASLHAGAIIDINAPYWVFPLLSEESEQHIHYLASSLLHEMEHAAHVETTVGDVFSDHEALTTFTEYLSVPGLFNSHPETHYLDDMESHLVHSGPIQYQAHTAAFYMALVIFANFLRKRLSVPQLDDIPSKSIHEQFVILKMLRKYTDPNSFIELGLECRKIMYQSGNVKGFVRLFEVAEKELGVKKKLQVR